MPSSTVFCVELERVALKSKRLRTTDPTLALSKPISAKPAPK